MIVVADSGPLHYLILLDHADLLRRFYGEVIVPDAVAIELSSPSAPSIVRDWILRPPPWVSVVPAEPSQIRAITDDLDGIDAANGVETNLAQVSNHSYRIATRGSS